MNSIEIATANLSTHLPNREYHAAKIQTRRGNVQKTKVFNSTRFDASTLERALDVVGDHSGGGPISMTMEISKGLISWSFDSREEFFAEYRTGFTRVSLSRHSTDRSFHFSALSDSCNVTVRKSSRSEIEAVFAIFDQAEEASRIPGPPPPPPDRPTIFIGHGRSSAWRDLKDHLTDQHSYTVQAYETGTRHGHTIRDILGEMLETSSFALLVLTKEDEAISGEMRARQNVVHELGLFQGRFGFARAIAVVEEGIELFSNMDGVQQIRFESGQIRQTFGDVLATLRREFGDLR
ncbi:TIR domain-containing protein [Kitasatospora sp. NPDC086009]|uniref:TIR domain-containing protein n=1 Tax=unclassified Kitasatospora TaxID=2633591 RepID=UPI0037C58937